jgi:hypothetical protein
MKYIKRVIQAVEVHASESRVPVHIQIQNEVVTVILHNSLPNYGTYGTLNYILAHRYPSLILHFPCVRISLHKHDLSKVQTKTRGMLLPESRPQKEKQV